MNKKDILNVMLPQMPSIVQQWDSTGIIIESQFLFASQHIMKHHMGTVYELIVEYGGHKVEDEYEYPLALATEIPEEGWMYYFFDASMISINDAKAKVEKYFAPQIRK